MKALVLTVLIMSTFGVLAQVLPGTYRFNGVMPTEGERIEIVNDRIYKIQPVFSSNAIDITGDGQPETIEGFNVSELIWDVGIGTLIEHELENASGVWTRYTEALDLGEGNKLPVGVPLGPHPRGRLSGISEDGKWALMESGTLIEFGPIGTPIPGMGVLLDDITDEAVGDLGEISFTTPQFNQGQFYVGALRIQVPPHLVVDAGAVEVRLRNPYDGTLSHTLNSTLSSWNCDAAGSCYKTFNWCQPRAPVAGQNGAVYRIEIHVATTDGLKSDVDVTDEIGLWCP